MKLILVVVSIMTLIFFASSTEAFNKADCSLPKDVGPCRKADLSYYYDSEAKACQTFFYGGCHGNNNRFNSQEQCEQSCL